MLNTLRDNLKQRSWPKWLLLVVAASMTLYLAASFSGRGPSEDTSSADWAAKVDGEAIPTGEFLARARRMDQIYRQLYGTNYDEARRQLRIGSRTLAELLDEEIMLRDARRLGLTVSDEELVERIRTAPELADPDGNFIGKPEYERRVGRFYAGGVAAYESYMARLILMDKWTNLISQTLSVDDADLESVYRQRTEKTAIDYIVIRSSDQEIDTTVTDEQAEAWYAGHQDLYERDAGRRIRYVTIQREAASDTIEVAEDEIAAAYEANQARYTHPEQRRASHILLRVDPGATEEEKEGLRQQAEDILARVQAGEDFAALARALSQDPTSGQRGGDLDWFGRGQMVGPFEEAAFKTPAGELAPLTETDFGFHVIQVTDSRAAGTLPIADVRDDLIRELRQGKAEEVMLGKAARVRELIGSVEALESVALAEGLEVQSGFVNETEGLREIGASTEFRTAILEMEAGTISSPLHVAGGVAIAVVDELAPASVAPLVEVDQKLRTDVLNDRARRMATDAAQQELERHDSLAGIETALDVETQDSNDLAPGQAIPGTGGSTAELQAVLFGDATEIGDRGSIEVPAGTLIYEVTRREPFDPIAFEGARTDLETEMIQQLRQQMQSSMLEHLRGQHSIEINTPLVERLDGGA